MYIILITWTAICGIGCCLDIPIKRSVLTNSRNDSIMLYSIIMFGTVKCIIMFVINIVILLRNMRRERRKYENNKYSEITPEIMNLTELCLENSNIDPSLYENMM